MSDMFPRLAYLALLLVVVGGFLIVELRTRPGLAARNMLAWGLIFLGVIAGFGLWGDIRQDIAPAPVIEGHRIELPIGPDGHFNLTLMLNDTPVRFVVDTGASDIALRQRDARRIGLDPEGLAFIGKASTANGIVATAPVTIKLIEIGDIVDENVPASVVQGEMGQSLLGMSYLRRFNRISFEGDMLVLER